MRAIDGDGLISAVKSNPLITDSTKTYVEASVNACPTIETEPRWIPFEARNLTDEEKEEHPDWDFIFDCQLPENGQQILVSIDIAGHERVQFDEFYDDDGIYLDSGYEIGEEAIAWLPLPKPYQEGKK